MEILNRIQTNEMYSTVFVMIIALSLLQFFDIKIIVAIAVVFLIYMNHDKFIQTTEVKEEHIKHAIKKDEISDDMYYNDSIKQLLDKLRKFKKYNKISYKQGVKYLRKFFKTIHILENPKITNYNQYFENAMMYLKQSINNFQSMTVSFSEENLLDGLKYGDYRQTKKTQELGGLTKQLYNQCYYLLLSLSIRFNKEWSENPHMYIKEIDMNNDRVESRDTMLEENWSLY